jgi:hypothetical protein
MSLQDCTHDSGGPSPTLLPTKDSWLKVPVHKIELPDAASAFILQIPLTVISKQLLIRHRFTAFVVESMRCCHRRRSPSRPMQLIEF